MGFDEDGRGEAGACVCCAGAGELGLGTMVGSDSTGFRAGFRASGCGGIDHGEENY